MSQDSHFSLTSHLLAANPGQFQNATQSPFLRLAAGGNLPKSVISNWLANDRLYMQGYIKLTGQLLRTLALPEYAAPSSSPDAIEVRLLDWLVDAMVNIRREERFFIDVAERYGLDINLASEGEVVPEEKKLEGLRKYEKLFASVYEPEPNRDLPWLEGLVVYWGTEKVYFDAWSWAKDQASRASRPAEGDLDGGAMRKEFIDNWTNEEFIQFVRKLEDILNAGVQEALEREGPGAQRLKEEILKRAETKYLEMLDAEAEFWPGVQGQGN